MAYNEIDERAPTDAKSRIDWLRRRPMGQYQPQPYEQLAAVFRKSGQEVAATRVLIAKEEDRKRLAKLTGSQWCWYDSLGPLIGYGCRPWGAFWVGLGGVACGRLVFGAGYWLGFMGPTKEWADEPNGHGPGQRLSDRYQKFDVLIYSLDVFAPLIDLYQASYRLPHAKWEGPRVAPTWANVFGGALRCYFWFYIIAGWTLTTLLVVGGTGLVRS